MTRQRWPVLRTAVLLLLSEEQSHGYELATRLAELGIEADMGALYRTLRGMDRDGDLRSSWDGLSSQGPARRVYAPTDDGLRQLHQALASMEEHGTIIGRLLHRAKGRQFPPRLAHGPRLGANAG